MKSSSDPTALMQRLVNDNPGVSQDKLVELFRRAALKDEGLLEAAMKAWAQALHDRLAARGVEGFELTPKKTGARAIRGL